MKAKESVYTVDDWNELCDKLIAMSEENKGLRDKTESEEAQIESYKTEIATLNEKITAQATEITNLNNEIITLNKKVAKTE